MATLVGMVDDARERTAETRPADVYLTRLWNSSFCFSTSPQTSEEICGHAQIESAADLIKRVDGVHTAQYRMHAVEAVRLVAPRLIQFSDARARESRLDDECIELTLGMLRELLSEPLLVELVRLFNLDKRHNIDSIVLRRFSSQTAVTRFRTIKSQRMMHVALNSESEYAGARRIFVHDDVYDSPLMDVGTVIVQDRGLVYGTSQLFRGTVYSLYIFGNAYKS